MCGEMCLGSAVLLGALALYGHFGTKSDRKREAERDAKLLERAPQLFKAVKPGTLPSPLTRPVPRRLTWVFEPGLQPSPLHRRLLESGTVVWALRVEGMPRPYEETGSDHYKYIWQHPVTGEYRLERFSTGRIDVTRGMTLVFPLLFDLETLECEPWCAFLVNVDATEERSASGR